MNTQPVADRFAFKTADALRRKAEELGAGLPFDQDIGVLFEETVVGGRRVPNRIAAQPMEGCDSTPEGAPADLTVRRYERFGAGGAGLIWFEATSVLADGRANPRQLLITPATAPGFRHLVGVTKAAARQRFGPAYEPYLVLQLTHSGRFSRTAPPGERRVETRLVEGFHEPTALVGKHGGLDDQHVGDAGRGELHRQYTRSRSTCSRYWP